jgi:energy-coupling factor transport system substrate-specific component
MSWQIGAFTILGLALAAGFAWYERTRPDARIVALVGTLAALAALGRIAFAALPNVKPTTDIVLIAGYALGGAPGFVVGALAGLTSNFFFGQGPWTPWQMAAWGAVGVLGALLARATGGRIGRWPLALVCGLVGYGFAAVQDVGDWVTFSDHSAAQLGVYVGRGTAFDFIHAGGCVVFALAFGPALTRSIARFAERLQVTWRALDGAVLPGLVLVALLAGALGALGPLGAAGSARAAGTPAGYLLSAQHRDGGFGSSPGASSSELYSGWAALGLAAAGRNPQDLKPGGRSLLAYIRGGGDSYSDVGALERTILVARAAGVSARSFGGRDLVARLERAVRGDGSVAEQVNLTAFAVLALRAAGVTPAQRTLSWLTRQQNHDGGFSFATAGGGSDVDDTGAALEALGHRGAVTVRAVSFVRGRQNLDGGFPAQPGGESNAQSSAWAIQGLLAAGVSPGSLHRRGAISPLSYLRSLIASDGHVRYSRSIDHTPVWVTAPAPRAADRTCPAPPARPCERRGCRGCRGRRGRRGTRRGPAGVRRLGPRLVRADRHRPCPRIQSPRSPGPGVVRRCTRGRCLGVAVAARRRRRTAERARVCARRPVLIPAQCVILTHPIASRAAYADRSPN